MASIEFFELFVILFFLKTTDNFWGFFLSVLFGARSSPLTRLLIVSFSSKAILKFLGRLVTLPCGPERKLWGWSMGVSFSGVTKGLNWPLIKCAKIKDTLIWPLENDVLNVIPQFYFRTYFLLLFTSIICSMTNLLSLRIMYVRWLQFIYILPNVFHVV